MQLLLTLSWKTNHPKIWADWQIFCTMAARERWWSMKKNSRKIRTLMVSCRLYFLIFRTTQGDYKPRPNDRNTCTSTQLIASSLSTTCCACLATLLQDVGTCCFLLAKRMQHFVPNNVAIFSFEMLQSFQGCCLTGARQPGAPKKVLWVPKFLKHLPKHYLLGS